MIIIDNETKEVKEAFRTGCCVGASWVTIIFLILIVGGII
jgi:hypothetical protein